MKVTLTEMELQALWYLDSLERVYGDEFRGEAAPKIWINVAMVIANMVDGEREDREVPLNLIHELVDRGLAEMISGGYRITVAGKETLATAT